MATYEEVINGNINSLKELKDLVKAFKDELATAKEGTQEWEDACEGLAVAQERVDKINKAAKGTLDDLNISAKDSINTLKERIKQLNAERNAMDINSQEYADATSQLKTLNDQLRNTGVAAGDMKANVGNYAESLSSGFKGINDAVGKASSKLISGVQGIGQTLGGLSPTLGKVTGGMKALAGAAGGVGIAIAAVAAAIKLFKEGVDSSSENTKKWKEIIQPIQALFAVLKEDLQALTSKVLDFGVALQKNEKFMKGVRLVAQGIVTAFLLMKQRVIDTIEVYKKWYNKLKEIASKIWDVFKPVADTISKVFNVVKNKLQPVIDWIIDKWNWLAKSDVGKLLGIKMINDAKEAWKEAGDVVEDYAARMKDVKLNGEGKGSGTKEDIELLKKKNELLLANAKLESEISKAGIELDKERSKEAKDYAAILDLLKEKNEAQVKVAENNVAIAQAELDSLKKRNASQSELTQAEVNLIKAQDALNQAIATGNKELASTMVEQRTQAVKDLNEALKEFDTQYSETMSNIAKPVAPESNEETVESLNAYYDAVKEQYNMEYEAYAAMTRQKIAALQAFIDKEREAGNDVTKQELELSKLRANQAKEYKKMIASQTATDKERKKAVKSNIESQISAYANLFGAVSEMFEENTLAYKITATARALIDTFLAANAVLAQQPGGYITKAVAMAATIAAGIANVIAIWKTDPKSPSVSTSTVQTATSTPKVDETPYTYAQTVQTAAAEETINQATEPTKVYVLESDITEAQERSKVRVQESEW